MKKYPALLIIGVALLIFGFRKNTILQAKWPKADSPRQGQVEEPGNQSSDSRRPRTDRYCRRPFRCFEETSRRI